MSGALGFNQESLLIYDEVRRRRELAPSSPEFPLVFRLRGRWDRGLLDEALRSLASRHTVLRTVYEPSTQYSQRQRDILLSTFSRHGFFIPGLYWYRIETPDIAVVERDGGGRTSDELVACAVCEGLEPSRPLVRAFVFHLDDETQLLVLISSHVICDGWSIRLLVQDFLKIYRALVANEAVDLPAVDIEFEEFAYGQHYAHCSGAFAAAEAFWSQQWSDLDGAGIRHAEIPFARVLEQPAPAISARTVWCPAATSVAVREAARRLKATPYVLFRTAMTVALATLLGKRRIAYWANFTNRRPGLEHLVGWCSNTHVVTVEVPEKETAAAVCQNVAIAMRQAQLHEAAPLSAIWQRLGTCLDKHDTRVNFDVWPMRRPAAGPPGPIDALWSSFLPRMDLDVRLMDDGERFGLRSTYNANRYDAAGVASLVSTIVAIVQRVADRPSITIDDAARGGEV